MTNHEPQYEPPAPPSAEREAGRRFAAWLQATTGRELPTARAWEGIIGLIEIHGLSPAQAACAWYRLLGYSFRAIARTWLISHTAAARHCHRGLRKLAQHMPVNDMLRGARVSAPRHIPTTHEELDRWPKPSRST